MLRPEQVPLPAWHRGDRVRLSVDGDPAREPRVHVRRGRLGRREAAPVQRVGKETVGLAAGLEVEDPGHLVSSAGDRALAVARAQEAPADVDLDIQVHYTPNGKEVVDHPQVGFVLARKEPKYRYISYAISAPNDAELVWFSPHMHVRGKDMTYRLEYPDGRKEIILNVPRYDFNWQLGYELAAPIKVPKGTRFVATAHFDNSANNKFNPEPNRTVYNGNQTWEEMMQPFFGIVVNKKVDPQKLLKRRGTIPRGAE